MAPPRRASSVSTKIVGFRLTEEETQRLDQLVQDLGHTDRSAMLRAWLAQSGPVPRIADHAPSHPVGAKTKRASVHAQQRAGETETAQSNRDKQTAPLKTPDVVDPVGMIKGVIQREKDPRTGLSPMPNVVRALLPHFTRAQLATLIDILCVAGKLELYGGGHERLSSKDKALCPTDPEGTLCTGVRWIGKE